MTARRALSRLVSPRPLALVICLLVGAAIGRAQQNAPPATAQPRATDHVVVISIDGFRPAMYLESATEGLTLPHLQALREAGSAAEGVEVSHPSMTYPSHTSLATGVRPARHGIISNTMFDPPIGSPRWYYEFSAVKVPALWDRAKAAGLTTAGASWPVTVGATMDVLFPESNQAPPDSTWLARARTDSTPGLVDAVVKELGGYGENDNRVAIQRDRFTAAMAAHIIRTARPNLLMIHLMETDTAQHADGPGSVAARDAIQRIDAHVGAIVRAADEAGIRARTTFIVTGDHGFSRVHALIQPNVILREGGWLTTNARGRVETWQAASHATAIRLRDPKDTALAARIEARFRELAEGRYRGIFRVVSRADLDALGAYPEAAFFIEPAEGYYVSDGVEAAPCWWARPVAAPMASCRPNRACAPASSRPVPACARACRCRWCARSTSRRPSRDCWASRCPTWTGCRWWACCGEARHPAVPRRIVTSGRSSFGRTV